MLRDLTVRRSKWVIMIIKTGSIRTWLYTSEFTTEKTEADIRRFVDGFRAQNKAKALTGFMVSNGKAVMQLLEGSPDAVKTLRSKIEQDERHHKISSEVWELEAERAYPHWSMRVAAPSHYEEMFGAIERSSVMTIATDIATMLFDTTFSD